MSNFKSGSGNLDFGGSDGTDEEDEAPAETTETQAEEEKPKSKPAEQAPPTAPTQGTTEESEAGSPTEEYPYFVRRNNVGDERDTRLEIHVRDKVADQEAEFRNAVANQLGVNEISKTDAREFALLAAFHHPERVAELMRNEGFGALG
ncbi:acyl-CoA dehydrogenase [Natronomonas salsuginis]|uniref:Acyl-CoA dehydrogenase n=1 Tax=Natronomonas salsuginis TaxID=2217661 RepID=A0A4U5JAE9_9EURY|nr:acyl-CoA dehydrogenase [Natronomonas salsuginis]TKR25146.1 acyl-CoA dehydrogenase [Natronomonas salsuginis]